MPARSFSAQGFFPDLPGTTWERLDQVISRFEAAWQAGERPEILDYLKADGEERRALLIELVHADLHHRLESGEAARVEDYLVRYPELQQDARVVVDLIRAEYHLRQRLEPGLPAEEYLRRFPQHREELALALLGKAIPSPGVAVPESPVLSAEEASGLTCSEEPVTRAFDHPLPPIALPEQFGRYRILRLLGQGGMGAVYLAQDADLDRLVALKVPHFPAQDRTSAVERFKRAAQVAARLTHPNLCPVYEVGEFQGIPYLTMPHLELPSLRSRLREGLSPTPQQAAALVYRLALALQAAHQAGIVHRDLNPGNILLNPDGEPVIVDFGLARHLDADAARLTQTGQVLGTPGYTAPEQLSGVPEAQGLRSDIFSLGVILYELLTCQLPFGRTLHEVLLQIMTRDPVPPSVRRPESDPSLDAVCLQALARKPEERYATMAELAAALLEYLRKQREPIEHLLASANAAVPEALVPEDEADAEPAPAAGPITSSRDRQASVRVPLASDSGSPPPQQPNASAEAEPQANPGLSRLRRKKTGWRPWMWIVGGGIAAGGLLVAVLFLVGTNQTTIKPEEPVAAPSPAPAPELLLCSSNSIGKYQLVLLALNGTDARIVKTLTNDEHNNTEPVWSPDGNKIAFISDRSGTLQIYVMDADGGNVQQLTSGQRTAFHPAWSPDGKKIAYNGDGMIFVMNADGTNPVALSQPGEQDSDPDWSPDGKKIAFCSRRNKKGFRLYVMDADGRNVRMLSARDNPYGYVYPIWSPDGQKIAYGDVSGGFVELFVCNADGSNQKQLTRMGWLTTRASWSPDGNSLVFRHLRHNAPDTLHIMQADGSNLKEIQAPIQGSDSGRLLWLPRRTPR